MIPTLAFNRHLKEALASLRRDLPTDGTVEIMVVLDGREVAPPAWIAQERVRLTSTGKRSGAARALNLGISRSGAEFIGRLDADDIWLSGRYEAQLDALASHPDVQLVAGNATLIAEDGTEIGEFPTPAPTDLRHQLLRRNPIVHSSVMFTRRAWEQVGGYNEACVRMQDYELWLRMARLGRLHHVYAPFAGYRVHEAQTSTIPEGFVSLMSTICRRRVELARQLNQPLVRQHAWNAVWTAAQYARYAKWRRPGYLKNSTQR